MMMCPVNKYMYTGEKSVKLDLKQFSLERGSKDCGNDDDNQKEVLPHSKSFLAIGKCVF